jgi:hypothetical protein
MSPLACSVTHKIKKYVQFSLMCEHGERADEMTLDHNIDNIVTSIGLRNQMSFAVFDVLFGPNTQF